MLSCLAAAPDCAKESNLEAAPPLRTPFRGWTSEKARFASVRVRHCGSWRGGLPSVCARPLQFYCSVLPQFARPALRLWRSVLPSVCARPLQFYCSVLPQFAHDLAILAGGLSSVHARPRGYGAAFCLSSRVRPCVSVEAVCPRFARWACNSGGAFCHRFVPDLCNSIVAFCLSSRMTSRFWRAVCPRFTPGIAVLARRFFSVHARPCSSIAAFCLGSRPAL